MTDQAPPVPPAPAPRPSVTVLIVTHNAGRFLEPAVRSVLDQAGVAVNVVVANNACTDGSVEALAPLVREVPGRIRVVTMNANLLHAGGLNAGLPHCDGEFLAMMDADDLSRPGRLQRQYEYLCAHPEADAVYCCERLIDEQDRPFGSLFCVTNPAQLAAYSRFDVPCQMHNLMFRRRSLAALSWRTEFMWAADYDFLQRAIEQLRFGCVREELYDYRVHPGMASKTDAGIQMEMAALCRLACARRRSGRPDRLAEELAGLEAGRDLTSGGIHVRYGRRFLQEGFSDLAIVFARRAWGDGRRREGLAIAGAALGRSLGVGHTGWLLRLALLGPAHALRIESHPPLPPRRWYSLFVSHGGASFGAALKRQAAAKPAAP